MANNRLKIHDGILKYITVQDASGKSTPPGFMWGNNFWLGVERACYLLNDPPVINLIKSENRKMFANMTAVSSEVPVEYRMFYASHTSNVQFDADLFNKSVLHVGICFPKSCTELEAQVMAENIFEKKYQNDLLYGNVHFIGTKTLDIRDKFLDEPFVVALL